MVIVLALLGLFAAGVVALLLVASRKPDSFKVERSIEVKAPADSIFALVNDFRRWADWSPWARIDPSMVLELSANPVGVGATYAWRGNSKVGQGEMAITANDVPRSVTIALHFMKPIEARNTTVFSFKSDGATTRVTWSMEGPQPFTSKIFATLVNMDKMVGGDFERGLASLKTLAEQD